MAKSAFATDVNPTKMVWIEKLFRETQKESYFEKFTSEGADNVVQRKTELEKGKGDRMDFTILHKLVGAGVRGSSGLALEGNEEAFATHSFSTYLDEIAHAVRVKGKLDVKRPFFDVLEEAKTLLKMWGTEKIDQEHFDALYAGAIEKIFYAGNFTTASPSLSNLTVADKILTREISWLKAWAATGGARSQNPFRPIMIGGKKHYILLTHPDAMYDLKQDATFQQAMRDAEVRGKENPLFTGAVAIWDNVVIHEHENVLLGTDAGAGSNIPYVKSVLLGAQALVTGYGARPEMVEETFDYEREWGTSWDMMMVVKRVAFLNKAGTATKDNGVLGYYSARTNVSGS